jgi:putative ABC transport system substrate-binding protein
MLDRRAFLCGSVAMLAEPLVAEAQQAGKVARVGFLSPANPSPGPTPGLDVLRQGLRELGWVEGQNVVIEYRFAEGAFDRLPDLAAELVRLQVDVIVAGSTPPALAARKATITIPIVMVGVGDPVGVGLIASFARPGGNVTGLSFNISSLASGKSLELLKEVLPKVRRVAVLSNPGNPSHGLAMREVREAALSLGVQLQPLEAREPNQFGGAFAAMAKGRAEALLVVPDSVFVLHRVALADLATRSRLPSLHGVRENVEAGGLMSYGASAVADFRRAALFVDKILKGAKPRDLPVEQPSKFELVINLRTAKALKLTIPPSLLARADQVIE